MPNRTANRTANRTTKGIAFLALIGFACAGLLTATDRLTAPRIAANVHAHEVGLITSLIGVQPTTAPQWVGDAWPMCNGITLIRTQTQGYGGPISALVAREGVHLRDLRVTAHQETPGIADFVSRPEDPWRRGLQGSTSPALDGVDGVAGATITSRALLTLIGGALDRWVPNPECPP